jgi:hypothetical protein
VLVYIVQTLAERAQEKEKDAAFKNGPKRAQNDALFLRPPARGSCPFDMEKAPSWLWFCV